MNGEIGVHNDAPLLNGKIGEDFEMGGAVKIKELMDLGSSVGSPVVDAVRLAAKGGIGEVGADWKEVIENGRAEGDDHRTGNCLGEDAVVKRCENGAPENGFSGANGHVLEIEGDVFKGKQGAVVISGSDVQEHRENGVLENGDCGAGGTVEVIEVGVLETDGCDVKLEDVKEADIADHNDDIHCGAEDHSLSNGLAREESLTGSLDSKVEDVVVEHQNGKVDVMESVDGLIGVGSESDYAEGLSRGGESHPAADTQGTTEEQFVDQTKPVKQEGLSQTEGSIAVEPADAKIHNAENFDDEIHKAKQTDTGLTVATEQVESAIQSQPGHTEPVTQEGLSQTRGSTVVEPADAKDYNVEKSDGEIHKAEQTDTELTVATEQIESATQSQPDHTGPIMQEGLSQTGGSIAVESSDDKIYNVEKSDDEIHKAEQTDADLTVASEQIESAIQSHPDHTEPFMQEWLSQTGGSIMVESADAKSYNVEKSDDEIHKAEQTDTTLTVDTEQVESAIQSQPDHTNELDLCRLSYVELHKVAEADIEALSADDKVEKIDAKMEEVEAGDVSVKEMSTMLENSSTEEAGTAKSDLPVEGHHNDASPAVAEPKCAATVLEVTCTDENKDDGDIVPVECLVASDEKDLELDKGNISGDSVESSPPLPTEVEIEEDIKNKVIDSDPSEVTTDTRTAVDVSSNSLAGNACAEAVICFGSFDQSELSGIPSEDLSVKKEDRHNVPGQDIDQSSCEAEVVDVTPQSDVVAAEVQIVAPPKEQTRFSEAEKRVFNYLIKTPRFDDHLLKSKISEAQLQVDEKTKIRDAIKAEMHGKKSIYKASSEKFGAAVLEEKAARGLFKSKRQDVDLVLNEINKVKNAMSLGEIDAEICGMEHSIQHETLPLKEEKELINKIRKLKQLRGQMSSRIGGEDELKEALNKREETEERLKMLKKDADSLRENCMKAEAITKAAKKIYYDDGEKLRELQTRFKEADEIRQDSYMQLQSLKKELYEKNKPFWKYRDDMKKATDLALKGDRESVSQFCIQQVETFMEAWNKSNEFREEYLKSNAQRTLRRLGTADGRSLGPNEEAPSIPPIINERQFPKKSFPPLPTPKLETVVLAVEVESSTDKVLRKDANEKKQKPKPKNTIKTPPEIETVLAILERDEVPEKAKDLEVTEEEREQARKAEELSRKEEAEKLLEQRRLEEKAKEKEALERKRRNAERASARAAQKAEKEAEQREKERGKRAKKKERRRLGNGNALPNVVPEGESQVPPEAPVEAAPAEVEIRDKAAPTRIPAKASHFTKHTKIAPIPAPLRNRGKRKMQTWMWVLAVALLVFALFLAGNAWNIF